MIVRRVFATFAFVTFAACMLVQVPALAQDDDLLGGLGDDDSSEPASKPPESSPPSGSKPKGEPAKKPADDEPLPDVDADAPLDTIEAAPAQSGGKPQEGKSTEAKEEAKKEEAKKVHPSTLDRVKAVQRKPVLKQYRVEIAPMFSVSLNDAFYTHLTIGGAVVFYPHDSFGIGLSGTYFLFHGRSDVHRDIRIGQTAVPAVFDPPIGGGTLDLYWNPIYGKISLADRVIIPFDIYTIVGAGVMVAGPNVRPAFRAGLGQRFLLNEWLGLRFEVVDTVYNDIQQVNGQPRSDLQNFIMFMLGASFFVPPSFEYSGL